MKQNKKYHFHFRMDMPFLYYQVLADSTDYFNIDYYYLYSTQPYLMSAFLSEKGIQQAKKMGIKLLYKNRNWKQIFNKGKTLFKGVDKLTKKSIPDFYSSDFLVWIKEIIKYTREICYTYFYCEAPVLSFLEENINDTDIAKKLNYIGHYKLVAHKKLSALEELNQKAIKIVARECLIKVEDIIFFNLPEFIQ